MLLNATSLFGLEVVGPLMTLYKRSSPVHYVISPEFFGEYENYTFLESLWHRQSEKQCCHLPPSPIRLPFYKMAALKQVFFNISAIKS